MGQGQWNNGTWDGPCGAQTQFSKSILFAMKVAQKLKNQTDGLRGGLRQVCLLLEPHSNCITKESTFASTNKIIFAFIVTNHISIVNIRISYVYLYLYADESNN